MSFSLLPKMIAGAVTDLPADFLRQKGIKLLIMDFDNTLVPYTTNELTPQVLAWLESMLDFPVCVVSNSKKPRVRVFCEKHGIPCFTHARKPSPKGILQAISHYGLKPSECALVGDQIFTDTLGGNRAGVRTILVKAIHNHNIWLKLRHVAEMPFIFLARNRRITL